MDKLFLFFVKNREKIITLFKLVYIVLFVLTIIAGRSLYLGDANVEMFHELAEKFGELAIVAYVITLIPGIARRFRINHKLIAIIMIYRRYIGITVFSLIFYHFWIHRGVDWFLRGQLHLPLETFELAGIIAGIIVTMLAVTSNDWSTKQLGVWWGRIHNLTYGLCWIIFIHVVLQAGLVDPWSLLLLGSSILVALSHLYAYIKRR